MQAGKLNRRIQIQVDGEGQNAGGEPVHGWIKFADAWANIKTVNGREYATSDSEASEVTTSIRIRYRTDLTAKMRVVYKNTIYSIVAVLPDEAGREYVDLACSSGVNDG